MTRGHEQEHHPGAENAELASASAASQVPATPTRGPSVALALGGGGARGLAHVLILEVFDELGIRPSFITGTSIGACTAPPTRPASRRR